MAAIADKPVEVANYVKHCEQRRKYPVLLRVEFQVHTVSIYTVRLIDRCLTASLFSSDGVQGGRPLDTARFQAGESSKKSEPKNHSL